MRTLLPGGNIVSLFSYPVLWQIITTVARMTNNTAALVIDRKLERKRKGPFMDLVYFHTPFLYDD